MLQHLLRLGPSRQLIGKAYVTSAELEDAALKALSAIPGVRVQRDPRNRSALLFVSDLVWPYSRVARQVWFDSLERSVQACHRALAESRIGLMPAAVGASNRNRVRAHLCADRHSVVVHDELEQAAACNWLGRSGPTIQSFCGRALVTTNGVERTHSRLGLESVNFPAIEWQETDAAHVSRMTRFLKEVDGIPKIERLEVFPSRQPPHLLVNSAISDATMWLSTARAVAILHQAICMRARRAARDGQQPPLGWRVATERNRARVFASGPAAALEPAKEPAWNRLLAVLLELRPELRALDVSYDEIAPLVVGPGLRKFGLPGLCSENDVIRLILTQSKSDRAKAVEQLTRQAMLAPLTDPMTAENARAFPGQVEALRHWWQAQLRPVATHDRLGQPARVGAASPRTPGKVGSHQKAGDHHLRGDRIEHFVRGVRAATAPPAELLRSLRPHPLYFGRLVAALSDQDKTLVRKYLAPESGRTAAIPAGSPPWIHALGVAALREARAGGIGIVVLDSRPPAPDQLHVRVQQLVNDRPADIALVSWVLIKTKTFIRQEFLVFLNEAPR